jgi:hypothetical protein
MLHPFELARRLKRTASVYDAAIPGRPPMYTHLTDAVVTVDPTDLADVPSASRNNVTFFGCERVVSVKDLHRVQDFYKDAGVSRYFFCLSPNPQLEEIKGWLVDRGFKRWEVVTYPTLLRSAERLTDHPTDLEIRCVDADEAVRSARDIEKIYSDPRFKSVFAETCGANGLHHFSHSMVIAPCRPASWEWKMTRAHSGGWRQLKMRVEGEGKAL